MWVTYIFERAILQSEEQEDRRFPLIEGQWTYPFPNEKGDSQAYGLWESFSLSENGWAFCEEAGEIVKIVVTKTRPNHFVLTKVWNTGSSLASYKAILT